jgi:DNA invertase Pin-like site-specific DNA recombinase
MTSLTQDQKDEIVRLYKLKVMNKNIATLLNISKHLVNNFIYKEYLLTNERAKNTCSHMKYADQVIDFYKKGFTYKEIMAMTGVKYHHLCEIIKLTEQRRIKPLTINIVKKIERMVEEKRRTCDIANELNLEYNKVSHWVRKAKKEGVH